MLNLSSSVVVVMPTTSGLFLADRSPQNQKPRKKENHYQEKFIFEVRYLSLICIVVAYILAKFTIWTFLLMCVYIGPNVRGTKKFECHCEWGNDIVMNRSQYKWLRRCVRRAVLSIPLYVCSLKRSNVILGKSKMVSNIVSTI